MTAVIPSAYRAADLERCLDAVVAMDPRFDDIIVVLRSDDDAGAAVVGRVGRGICRRVTVDVPGVGPAMKVGIEATETEWVCFFDDDAEPGPDWMATLLPHLDDPSMGLVGGRIMNFVGPRSTAKWLPDQSEVTAVRWPGRGLNRLHDMPEHPRSEAVLWLPGSNVACRTPIARAVCWGEFPDEAPHWELDLAFCAQERGYRVWYDSKLVIAHYTASRPPGMGREGSARRARTYAHCLSLIYTRHASWPALVGFWAYFGLVGQRVSPGLVALPAYVLRRGGLEKWSAAARGRRDGLVAGLRLRGRGGIT